uniref:Uncharacterized protein n=1 Tax=Anabas testudineus TaxID=64144 RepID=A0A3Q1JHK4_ANATE
RSDSHVSSFRCSPESTQGTGVRETRANNGTCAEQLSLFPPFSSTLALLVLVAVLVGIVLVSLATFHFHKRKLRNRKIQRAQEEYERDSRNPARAGEPARPCVIVRPARSSWLLLMGLYKLFACFDFWTSSSSPSLKRCLNLKDV